MGTLNELIIAKRGAFSKLRFYKWGWGLLLALSVAVGAAAQDDALNLPAALYVLLNDGVIERYGVGTEGVMPVTPDDAFIIDFGVAPDGNWLAYRTQSALVMHNIWSGEARVLDDEPGFPLLRGQGATVAWAPDGQRVAYTTAFGLRLTTLATAGGITTVDVLDAGANEIMWSPDGRYLAARGEQRGWHILQVVGATAEALLQLDTRSVLWTGPGQLLYAPQGGGLVQLDVASGNQTDVLPPGVLYRRLAERPTGEIAVFRRDLQNPLVTDGQGSYAWVNVAARREALIGAVNIDLDGLRWTPDGAFLVAFEGGALALINPINGAGFTLPVTNAVAYDWGVPLPPEVTSFALPDNLFFLAADEAGVVQLWQMPPGAAPFPLTQATADVTRYAVALDGRFAVYSSDSQLWLASFTNGLGTPIPLTALTADTDPAPDVSPDGQTIAYADGGVQLVSTSGDGLPLLADTDTETYHRPRWSPDGTRLLVEVRRGDGAADALLDLGTASGLQPLTPATTGAFWLADGRIAAAGTFADAVAGIQIVTPNDLSVQNVFPQPVSVVNAVPFGVDGFRLVEGTGIGPEQLHIADFRAVAGLLPVLSGGFVQQPRLSPDGGMVAGYVQASATPAGRLTLVNVATGEQVVLAAPERVAQVQWQR